MHYDKRISHTWNAEFWWWIKYFMCIGDRFYCVHLYDFDLGINRNQVLTRLTHWGRMMHIYVGKLTIIGSDNVLSPGQRQAIIWTNAGILLIGHLGTNFSEILIKIHTFSFKKIGFRMSSGKWRPSCLGLNVKGVNNGVDHGDAFKASFILCKSFPQLTILHQTPGGGGGGGGGTVSYSITKWVLESVVCCRYMANWNHKLQSQPLLFNPSWNIWL